MRTSGTMRDVVGGIRTVVLVAVTLAALLPVAASAAVKPKPWMWTPTQAAQRLDVALDHAHWLGGQDFGRAEPSSCRGTGKQPVRARWLAFTCTFPWRVGDLKSPRVTRTAWVKVRQAGKGGACISVTGAPNVNPKCLTAKGLVQSSDSSAAGAIQVATTKRFRPESSIPWQGFTRLECVGVDGFYECSFISAVSGTATVMFRASGPTVIYTSLDCQGAYAGHPECTLP